MAKPRRPAVRKLKCKMYGGPLNGHVLLLESPGTLKFTLGGERGYYDSFNNWIKERNDG